MAKESRSEKRAQRHRRVRQNLSGTAEMPRLCVFRSIKNISVQVIDDVSQKTLVSASSLDAEIKTAVKNGGNKEAAKKVGQLIAKRAI
ncbi:MAG: 50S ribosomal protein L18, partial [Anaerovoracaceae bacterium]